MATFSAERNITLWGLKVFANRFIAPRTAGAESKPIHYVRFYNSSGSYIQCTVYTADDDTANTIYFDASETAHDDYYDIDVTGYPINVLMEIPTDPIAVASNGSRSVVTTTFTVTEAELYTEADILIAYTDDTSTLFTVDPAARTRIRWKILICTDPAIYPDEPTNRLEMTAYGLRTAGSRAILESPGEQHRPPSHIGIGRFSSQYISDASDVYAFYDASAGTKYSDASASTRFFPTPEDADDAFVFKRDDGEIYEGIYLTITTPAVLDTTDGHKGYTWQYLDDQGTWNDFDIVLDSTNSFSRSGYVFWEPKIDWAESSIPSDADGSIAGEYGRWVRCVLADTIFSTEPLHAGSGDLPQPQVMVSQVTDAALEAEFTRVVAEDVIAPKTGQTAKVSASFSGSALPHATDSDGAFYNLGPGRFGEVGVFTEGAVVDPEMVELAVREDQTISSGSWSFANTNPEPCKLLEVTRDGVAGTDDGAIMDAINKVVTATDTGGNWVVDLSDILDDDTYTITYLPKKIRPNEEGDMRNLLEVKANTAVTIGPTKIYSATENEQIYFQRTYDTTAQTAVDVLVDHTAEWRPPRFRSDAELVYDASSTGTDMGPLMGASLRRSHSNANENIVEGGLQPKPSTSILGGLGLMAGGLVGYGIASLIESQVSRVFKKDAVPFFLVEFDVGEKELDKVKLLLSAISHTEQGSGLSIWIWRRKDVTKDDLDWHSDRWENIEKTFWGAKSVGRSAVTSAHELDLKYSVEEGTGVRSSPYVHNGLVYILLTLPADAGYHGFKTQMVEVPMDIKDPSKTLTKTIYTDTDQEWIPYPDHAVNHLAQGLPELRLFYIGLSGNPLTGRNDELSLMRRGLDYTYSYGSNYGEWNTDTTKQSITMPFSDTPILPSASLGMFREVYRLGGEYTDPKTGTSRGNPVTDLDLYLKYKPYHFEGMNIIVRELSGKYRQGQSTHEESPRIKFARDASGDPYIKWDSTARWSSEPPYAEDHLDDALTGTGPGAGHIRVDMDSKNWDGTDGIEIEVVYAYIELPTIQIKYLQDRGYPLCRTFWSQITHNAPQNLGNTNQLRAFQEFQFMNLRESAPTISESLDALPVGAIVMWAYPHTRADIPDGWIEYTDARDSYIRGAGGNYGVKASSGTNVSHSHPMTISGTSAANDETRNIELGAGINASDSTAHTHTVSSTPSTFADTTAPEYDAVLFIQKVGEDSDPLGITTLWGDTLATIPSGFVLQTSGTGDAELSDDAYVRGAGATESPGDTGGAAGHQHWWELNTNSSTAPASAVEVVEDNGSGNPVARPTHTHNVRNPGYEQGYHINGYDKAATLLAGSRIDTPTEILSRELAFLMKTATGAYPSGTIILWDSPKVPSGWMICDGTNGTTDMRGYFLRQIETNATNPGTTYASHTHECLYHDGVDWKAAVTWCWLINEDPDGFLGKLGADDTVVGAATWHTFGSPPVNQSHDHQTQMITLTGALTTSAILRETDTLVISYSGAGANPVANVTSTTLSLKTDSGVDDNFVLSAYGNLIELMNGINAMDDYTASISAGSEGLEYQKPALLVAGSYSTQSGAEVAIPTSYADTWPKWLNLYFIQKR